MHTAFECTPLLSRYKGRPEAIVAHGAKLFLGSSTGCLSVYRTDQGQIASASDEAASDSAAVAGPSQPVQTSPHFSKRSIDQLGVIKETGQLVSLSDSYVSLHDLATLELHIQLTQTRGALTFSIDTSIQKRIARKAPDYGPGPLGGIGSSRTSPFFPAMSTALRAFRPGAVGDHDNPGTVSRNRSSVFDLPSKDWQAASMRGMDAMAEYKDKERRKAMEEARFGGGDDVQDGVMTLVTVLAVGLKRKIILFRWVDGEFWDTREMLLQHTPRYLAFVTPTRLFMGYNATEYGVLSIPLAADSTVAYTHPSASLYGDNTSRRGVAHVDPPTNSVSGPLVDLTAQTLSAWHVDDFDLPSAGEAAVASGGNQPTSAAIAATTGFGAALGGLGGYMGLGGKAKMSLLQVDGGEVLFVRDNAGIFLGADGRPTRRDGIDWPVSPLEVSFARPYVFAILPGGSIPALKNSSLPNAHNPVLQIRSIGTLFAVQTLCFPPVEPSASKVLPSTLSTPPHVRLLTASTGSKPPVYVVVSSGDRSTLEREGSVIWRLDMQEWSRQIDELVEKGEFEEALGLLDSVDNVILEDKDTRRAHVQRLYALSLFTDEKYDEAVEMFMELDTNPAKVIGLYPENVAGELSRSKEEWFPMFGGTTPARFLTSLKSDSASVLSVSPTPNHATSPSIAASATNVARSRLGAFLPSRRPQSMVGEPSGIGSGGDSSLGSSPTHSTPVKPKTGKSALGQDHDQLADTVSIRSVGKATAEAETRSTAAALGSKESAVVTRKPLEALGRFLADRRRIFKPMLETSAQLESKDHMAMSQIKRDTNWLLSLPNKPFSELDKEELIAVAQTVDTALFKVFLQTKPALIGPLCRIENWCEVEQVEELLKERKKFSELIALYGGKEMHTKALGLLRQFADEEEEPEEKARPTIQYLQNLGPEFMETILETSHWVLELDAELGMEIFTADTGKVGSWPRLDVVEDLNRFDKDVCAVYLEFIIEHGGEGEPELHDKLIKLYLGKATMLRKETDDMAKSERHEVMQKLLRFLRRSTQYRPEQILVRLPAEENDGDMFEARALLLGRMGQHEGALGIYVRKLNDTTRAEEYCKEIWEGSNRKSGWAAVRKGRQQSARALVDEAHERQTNHNVFLTLVKIYLGGADAGMPGAYRLDAALGLIERHAAKIDLRAVLSLLPATVALSQIGRFIETNVRDQTRQQYEAMVRKYIGETRNAQLQDTVRGLQSRRVKVAESRTCAQCHKRLGNSVVAVNPVYGSVMHYYCSMHGEHPERHGDALATDR